MKNAWRFQLRKIGESYLSVIPIVLVITTLYFLKAVPGLYLQGYIAFLISAFFIGLGLVLFNFGCENSISKIGSLIGSTLFKRRQIFLIGAMTFILGFLIALAEPDLKIMAVQTGFEPKILIFSISLGVGLFLLIGVLRILFKQNLQVLFLAFYAFIFAFPGLINPKFIPLSFDSGAVVTGPLTIPFILSFGAALSFTRSEKSSGGEDAFGLTALVTAGPILSVMVLSFFYKDAPLTYHWDLGAMANVQDWSSFKDVLFQSASSYLLLELKDLALAISPIALFFLLYNFLFLHLRAKEILKIFIGLFYSYLGMVLFLSAVMVGFLPMAQNIGYQLGLNPSQYPLSLVLGALFGLFGVLAEPAVHVLVKQIEEVSEGTIKAKTVLTVMALSIGGGIALAVVRAHYGFSLLYYFIPIYGLALALSFFVPKIYANIAFDSGSIASGPMAASFVMPFLTGYTYASHGEEAVYSSAFGTIAMVSAMPLVVIQLLGLYVSLKNAIIHRKIRAKFVEQDDCQVIHFPAK